MRCLGLAPTALVRVGREVGVAADDSAEIPPAVFDSLLGLLREPSSPEEVVVGGEVRSSKSPVFASCHMLPTALREKTVIGARNEPRSVLEPHAISGFYSSPVIEHSCFDISPVTPDDDRSVEFISNTQVGEGLCPSVPHQNRGVAGLTVGTSMEASSVGVEAPAEADVGAFVFGENAPGLFLEDLEGGFRRLAQVLDVS